jgi:hypothetical protein
MGGKSDMASREDRPESGGAERAQRDQAALQERETQKLAQDLAEKRASTPEHAHDREHAPFSIGNEPNNAKDA